LASAPGAAFRIHFTERPRKNHRFSGYDVAISVKRIFLRLGIIFGGWTSLALIASVNSYVVRTKLGMPEDFTRMAAGIFLEYWIYAALTPAVLYMAQQFPFKEANWPQTVFLHFCFYFVFSWASVGLGELLHVPMMLPKDYHGSTLWIRFLGSFYYSLWMYWPIVIIWNAYEYYERYTERDRRAVQLETELTRAELEALRNQLHPHFLFNTLNSIASLMHEDVQGADDMIADLSYMLRAYLKDTSEQEISLRQELDLLETYLRIQKRRFENQLTYELDVPETLYNAAVPTLLLQPFVENAILHGIAPRTTPGHVIVAARQVGVQLVLSVADDGVGCKPVETQGIGMTNSRSRLKQLYGENQSLELVSHEGRGTTVTVKLPFQFILPISGSRGDGDDEDTNLDRGRRTSGETTNSVIAPA
jgi:signal transduction histidine kinase